MKTLKFNPYIRRRGFPGDAVGTGLLAGMSFVCSHRRDGDARKLNCKQISL